MKLLIANRELRLSLLGISVYIVLLVLLCSLGFWQLDRSEQKRQFLEKQQQAMADETVINLNQQSVIDLAVSRYLKVQVHGHYDVGHQFLIDNQMQDGKPGYYVLTPFLIDNSNRAVLVNRGWLPLGAERSHLPAVEINTAVSEINGRINQFPAVGIKLKGAEIPTNSWPALVQVVDSEVLAAKLAYGLYNFQIELDAEASEGYKRQWKISAIISPEKHLAYAVQWFGLALALTGLFIWISSRKLK
ncbi:SURF1 family protein [Methylomonas sp. AM2-LC]|uniref:SURF1 family protein n=1 Tax=Methylomonas sp. AM2-LC TaxID=3153301 RepID=UPI00326341B1